MTRYIYSAEEAVQLLNETEKARASLALEAKDLRDQISDLNAENIELKKCLAEIEEREAACCPEDVAFDEQIVALRKLVEQMLEALETADALINRLLMGADYAAKEVEEIRAAIAAAKGGSTSKTPRTDEIIKDFVSGNGEAASIMLLRQDVEQLENELADKDRQIAEMRTEIEKQDTLLEKCLSLLKQQKEKEKL